MASTPARRDAPPPEKGDIEQRDPDTVLFPINLADVAAGVSPAEAYDGLRGRRPLQKKTGHSHVSQRTAEPWGAETGEVSAKLDTEPEANVRKTGL